MDPGIVGGSPDVEVEKAGGETCGDHEATESSEDCRTDQTEV